MSKLPSGIFTVLHLIRRRRTFSPIFSFSCLMLVSCLLTIDDQGTLLITNGRSVGEGAVD